MWLMHAGVAIESGLSSVGPYIRIPYRRFTKRHSAFGQRVHNEPLSALLFGVGTHSAHVAWGPIAMLHGALSPCCMGPHRHVANSHPSNCTAEHVSHGSLCTMQCSSASAEIVCSDRAQGPSMPSSRHARPAKPRYGRGQPALCRPDATTNLWMHKSNQIGRPLTSVLFLEFHPNRWTSKGRFPRIDRSI